MFNADYAPLSECTSCRGMLLLLQKKASISTARQRFDSLRLASCCVPLPYLMRRRRNRLCQAEMLAHVPSQRAHSESLHLALPSVLVQHTSIRRQEKPNERTDKPPRCEPPERAGARRACITALRLQSDANRPWAHLPPHALLDGFELRHICFGFGIQVMTRPINRNLTTRASSIF